MQTKIVVYKRQIHKKISYKKLFEHKNTPKYLGMQFKLEPLNQLMLNLQENA